MMTADRKIRRNGKEARTRLAAATTIEMIGGSSLMTTVAHVREACEKYPWVNVFVESAGTLYVQCSGAGYRLS